MMPCRRDEERLPVGVWASELSWAALPALLAAFVRHGRFGLYVASSSRAGRWLGGLLRTLGLVTAVQLVELAGYGERVDQPNSASFRIQQDIERFIGRFFEAHGALLRDARYPDARIEPAMVLANLRQAAVTTTYFLLAFVEEARCWHREQATAVRRLIIISPLAVLANHVAPGWAGDDVEFVPLWSRHQSIALWLALAAWHNIEQALRPKRHRADVPAAVGVEYAHGLDRSKLMDDLFWWWDSGIPAERIVLLFDRADSPARRDIVSQAQSLGIRCVVVNRQAAGDLPDLLWRPAPGVTTSVRRLWQACRVAGWGWRRGGLCRWIACQLQQMLCWSERLEDCVTEFNVRALFHYQDLELDAPSLACNASGAARIGYQWSHVPWPMADQVHLHQVYFAWGRETARLFEPNGSCVDHLLLSGCIVRGAQLSPDVPPPALRYRQALVASGATRILALFDSSLPCDRFYETFLQRVLDDPRWGLLIKRKRNTSVPWIRRPLPQLEALYHRAEATGRVRMLEPWMSPAHASAAADVAVGITVVGTSSPTIVAALAGHRAIQLDYQRLHESYLSAWATAYRAGPDRLVFDDPDRLWAALNRFFDEPDTEPGLGVMDESLLRQIDPFRDGLAGARIGDYVRWYLEGLDQGWERDRALDEADRRYAQRWGPEAVVSSPAAQPVTRNEGDGVCNAPGRGLGEP